MMILSHWQLNPTVNLHLGVYQPDHFVNDFIGWHTKVLWSLVIASNHAINGGWKKWLAPATVFHEVQEQNVVEV